MGGPLSQQRSLSDLERQGLINEGETWMEMIRHRNLSAHSYDEATVLEIVAAVVTSYLDAFEELETRLQAQESLP